MRDQVKLVCNPTKGGKKHWKFSRYNHKPKKIEPFKAEEVFLVKKEKRKAFGECHPYDKKLRQILKGRTNKMMKWYMLGIEKTDFDGRNIQHWCIYLDYA